MTLQRYFSFSFPEKMDGLIDFLFVRSLFLGIRPSKTMNKSDIKILVYNPIKNVRWQKHYYPFHHKPPA